MDDQLGALRRWHTLLLRAMLATDRGSMTEARTLRVRAYEYGMACGLVEHANAFAATEFEDLWLRGRAASMRDVIGAGLLDPERSLLTRAGSAAVMAAAGDLDTALGYAEAVARGVLAQPIVHGAAALALVSEVLMHSADRSLVMAVRERLAAKGESMIVLGAGAASFGPASRYVAHLTPAVDERRSLLENAQRFADRSGALLWRAIARRDRAVWFDDDGARRELAELVHGTELADLAL
jgi:hypothetical protein